ncbi:MAG: sulfatase [Fuerstiella sp.]|nr:sulfatase [Fuerstiella sp.]
MTFRFLATVMFYTMAAVCSADRPNFLMIAVDDLRPMLGCYGHPGIRTPNIDRLAERGFVFERAYCQYAKCGTSRLSLMTGLRPDTIGVFSNNEKDVAAFRKRRSDAPSIAAWMKQHGYHTQSFGKIFHDGWDNAADWSVPSSPGRPREMWEIVDHADPTQPTLIAERLDCPLMQSPDVADDHLFAGRMTTDVIASLNRLPQDRSAFLAVGYRRPHLPFIAPKKYFDLYQPDKSWLAPGAIPGDDQPIMAWYNSDGYVGSARRVGLTMPNPPNRQQAMAWNGYEMRSYVGVPNQGPIDVATQLRLLQAYAACVSYADAQIGRLLDAVDHSEQFKDATIILWSDHGWHLGEKTAWGKMSNYEIATRVPLIMAGPDISPGRTQAISELVDLYPTICQLAGVQPPGQLQGESLVNVLQHPRQNSDAIAFSQYSRFNGKYMGRAIRTDRYRFVAWKNVKTQQIVERELYDHQTDPHETRNMAAVAENAELVRQLEHQLNTSWQ